MLVDDWTSSTGAAAVERSVGPSSSARSAATSEADIFEAVVDP
jgi:hypothetical protein